MNSEEQKNYSAKLCVNKSPNSENLNGTHGGILGSQTKRSSSKETPQPFLDSSCRGIFLTDTES